MAQEEGTGNGSILPTSSSIDNNTIENNTVDNNTVDNNTVDNNTDLSIENNDKGFFSKAYDSAVTIAQNAYEFRPSNLFKEGVKTINDKTIDAGFKYLANEGLNESINNNKYLGEINKLKDDGELTKDKLLELNKKYKQGSTFVGNTVSYLTSFDTSEDKFNKASVDDINNLYKDKGINISDHTSLDIMDIGTDQIQSDINGALGSESQYLNTFVDKTGITEQEVNQYDIIKKTLNSGDISSLVPGYNDAVIKYGKDKVDTFYKEYFNKEKNKFEDKLNSTDRFMVNLPGIGGGSILDSSETSVDARDLYNRYENLKDTNDEAIKKSTGLTRDKFYEKKTEEDRAKIAFHFDDTTIEGIKNTKEFNDKMDTYKDFNPEDRSVKQDKLAQNELDLMKMDEKIDSIDDGFFKDELKRDKAKLESYQTLLGNIDDQVIRGANTLRNKGQYTELDDKALKNKVLDKIINNLSNEDRQKYKLALDDIDFINANSSLAQGVGNISDLGWSNVLGGAYQVLDASYKGASAGFGQGLQTLTNVITSPVDTLLGKEKLRDDMFDYSSGIRNDKAGLLGTIADMRYNVDDMGSFAFGFIGGAEFKAPGELGVLVSKIKTIDKVANKLVEGNKDLQIIVGNINKGIELTKEQRDLLNKSKKLKKVLDDKDVLLKNKQDITDAAKLKQTIDFNNFKAGKDIETATDKLKWLLETNPALNKIARAGTFVGSSILTNMKIDAGIDQSFGGITGNELLQQNMMFNIIGDSIMGSQVLGLGKKYFTHLEDTSDVAKLFNTRKDLNEGVDDIRRRVAQLNGGKVITKNEALDMIKLSMKSLSAYSSKNARKLDSIEDIQQYLKDILNKKPNKANIVTDDGKIISFADNLSLLNSQETRLSEFTRLYNNAKARASKTGVSDITKEKAIKARDYYKSKINDELELIEGLGTGKVSNKFLQKGAAYLGSDLKISNKDLRAEKIKEITDNAKKIKEALKSNKKVNTDVLLNNLKDTITKYDESSTGGRLMRVYDPLTQKSITIDTKAFKIQSEALATEQGISVDEAEKIILSKGGMTLNVNYRYADVDINGKLRRVFGFSDKDIKKRVVELGGDITNIDTHKVDGIKKLNKFKFNNKRSEEVNKAYGDVINISDQTRKGYNVSFKRPMFGKEDIDAHIEGYLKPGSDLNIHKNILELNNELSGIIDGLQIDEGDFIKHITNNLHKLLQTNSHLGTMDLKNILQLNSSFTKLSSEKKKDLVIKISDIYGKYEMKFYKDVMNKELGEDVFSKNTLNLGTEFRSGKDITEMSGRQDGILTFVSGSLYKEDYPHWNNIIYIMPGSKSKGSKEYQEAYKEVLNRTSKGKKGAAALQPMRDFTKTQIESIHKLKGISGDSGLDLYMDIIKNNVDFNEGDYINDIYRDIYSKESKKDKDELNKESTELKGFIGYLKDNILDGKDEYLDNVITKNFIHNYILQKDEIKKILENYDYTDANFAIMSKIFMSDISMQGVLNYSTNKQLSKNTGGKLEKFLEGKWNEEKRSYDLRYADNQKDIDELRIQIDNNDTLSGTIELQNRLKKLIDNQKKSNFISKEDYIKQNLGLGLYQQQFNTLKTKIIDYVNKVTKPGVEVKKVDLNKLKISEKKRIKEEMIKLSNKDGIDKLDIENELKILDDKRNKISNAKEEQILDLEELKQGLGKNISKEDKQLAMDEFIAKKDEDINNLNKLIEQLDSITKIEVPKKTKGIKGEVVIEPNKVIKDYSNKYIKRLRKDIKESLDNISSQIQYVESIGEELSYNKIDKLLNKINGLEIKSQVFDDIYNDIRGLEDITKFNIESIEGSKITYKLLDTTIEKNIEDLSELQIESISNILLSLQKDRQGITELNLNIDELRNAKNQIFTEREIGDVIYKDITNSLFLNYLQKDEHSTIIKNFNKLYNNSNKEGEGQYLMSKLYNNNRTKFKKIIDGFVVKDLKHFDKIDNDFEKFVGDLIEGVSYTYRSDDGVLKTINNSDILKQLDLKKLRNRFLSLRNQDPESVLKMGTEVGSDGFPKYVSGETQFVETSIVYNRLKDNLGDNIRYIEGQSEKGIILLAKTLPVFKFKSGDELAQVDMLGLINGTNLQQSFKYNKKLVKGTTISKQLRDVLGLDKGEILTLGFGDKDGFSIIYKNTDLKNYNKIDQTKILELAYFYDMAINSGFINIDVNEAKKIWKGFITKINKEKDYSFDKFQEELFLYEKDGIRLANITSGAKRYKDNDNELIQGFRMFKTSSDNIRKRLGSSASKRYLFQDYKGTRAKYEGDLDKYIKSKGHKTFILREFTETKLEDLLEGVDNVSDKIEIFKKYAEGEGHNIQGIINKRFDTNTDEQIWKRIKAEYLDDNTDGTGYITHDIGGVNGNINGGSQTVIKAHIQGVNDEGKINLGKGQLNAKNINIVDDDGNIIVKSKDLTESLFLGNGMHKIKGGATELKGTGRYVSMKETIDGVEREVKMEIVGIDDNIDYSYYKEATSTNPTKSEDVSINNMIGSYDYHYIDELNTKIKNNIDKAISDFENTYNIDLGIQGKFGDINVVMEKLLSTKEELRFSDQYYNNKFDGLIDSLKGMIDKVRTGGSGLKALRVDQHLHPDDIVIHPDSDLAKQLTKDFGEGNTHYVVTTRYPISDTYVSGLYRVRYSKDIDKKHIITHPENAFYKLRADFDGDTITTYSAKDDYASIAARAIYETAGHGDAKKLTIDDILNNIEEQFKDNNFRLNTYIEAKEVDAIKSHKYRSFVSNTYIAQKAKNGISIGSATVRTGDIMYNAARRLVESKDINIELNKMNLFVQIALLKGVLGKDLIKIKFKSMTNDEQLRFVANIVGNILKKDDVKGFNKSLGIKDYYNHYDEVLNKIIEISDDSTVKKINAYIYENFDTNINKDFGLDQSDINKLGNINHDRDYATISGELLNDFLDFGKSGKESIPLDFDKKLFEKMYGKDMNYKDLKETLKLLSTNNVVKWKDGIRIDQHNFKEFINNNVSGNGLELWNHAYDGIKDLIKIRKASNEVPFLLKRFDSLLDDEGSKELQDIFKVETKNDKKYGKTELETSYHIDKLLYDLTGDILGSTTYIPQSKLNKFKILLNKHIPNSLKDKLIKLNGDELAFNGMVKGEKGYNDAYNNISKSSKDVFNEIQNIKNNGEIKDKIVIALLSKTFSKDRQNIFKEFNVNNISLQNVLSDSLMVDYFKYATLNKQSIIKNKFKNFNIDTKNAYLNQIKDIRDSINNKILGLEDKYKGIDDIHKEKLDTIQTLYNEEKLKLNKEYDNLLEQSSKLDLMNKRKSTYKKAKQKYDEDIIIYNNNVDQLEKDNLRVKKELEDYTKALKEYQSTIDFETSLREQAGNVLGKNVSYESNSELITQINKKLDTIEKDIPEDINLYELQLDQKNIKLNSEGDKYIVGDEEYDRISDYTTPPFEVKPGYEDIVEHSSDIGKEAESVIRKVLSGETPKLEDYNVLKNFKDGEFDNFIEQAKLLKKRLKGEKIYAMNMKLKDDELKLAGSINLITKVDGKYKLYDIKTVRDNTYYNQKIEELDDKIGNKLSMYAHIFNKNYVVNGKEMVIDEINVIPFKTKYDYSDVLNPDTNKLESLRDIHHIQLDDTISLTMKDSLEEINADLIIKRIQSTDTVRDPLQTYRSNIEQLDKYLEVIDNRKKSLIEPEDIETQLGNIDDLKEMKVNIDKLEKDINNQEAIINNVEELKNIHKKEVNKFKDLNKGFKEDELHIEDLYVGWDKQMTTEVANNMKGVLDTFKGQWHFQFIDDLQSKDPELLDRINAISFNMGADFDKINDETIEWNKIITSIGKSLDGKVSNELVNGLSIDDAKILDKEYQGFWKRIRSTFIGFAGDKAHGLGKILKDALNKSLIGEGGEIKLDKDLFNKHFKKLILEGNNKKVNIDDNLKGIVKKYFPDLNTDDITEGHIEYILLRQNKELDYNIGKYFNGTVTYAINKINKLDSVVGEKLDILSQYAKKNVNSHLIDDIIEAKKGDNNLAVISMGLQDKKDFMKRLEDRGFSTKDANILYNHMYKKERVSGQKAWDFLNFITYEIKYGVGNLLHGAGTVAATIQMPGQYTEIMARNRLYKTSNIDAKRMIDEFGFGLDEDTNVFASGIGTQSVDNPFNNWGTHTVSNIGYQLDKYTNDKFGKDLNVGGTVRASIDYAINPLGKQDAPFDIIRRETAVKQAMSESGYDTYEDFILAMNKYGEGEKIRFQTKVRMIYNELGGGVSSKDSLYKINKMFNTSGFADIDDRSKFTSFVMRAWNSLGGYLVHWMANKTMRQFEITRNLVVAAKKGDIRALNELSKVAMARAANIAYLTTMGLKYDKYQTINTDRKDGQYKLVSALANDIVAVNAGISFIIDRYERNKLMDLGMGDEALTYLQSFTKRFTGPLNTVPNLIDSLYSKVDNKEFKNLSDGELFSTILGIMASTIRDNGGSMNRYGQISKSEYGSLNPGISFSSITGQGVGGREGAIESQIWKGYIASEDYKRLEEEGLLGYTKFIGEGLIGTKLFKNNSTEINRTAQTLRIASKSNLVLDAIDKAFYDGEGDINSIIKLLRGGKYSQRSDEIEKIYNGKKEKVNKNDIIVIKQIQDYYRKNGYEAIYKLNKDGSDLKADSPEEQFRNNLIQESFGNLGDRYDSYVTEGGTHNFQTYVNDYIAGYITKGNGDIILNKEQFTVPEITSYIINDKFTESKKQFLKDKYGENYYRAGKSYDDINEYESQKLYLGVLGDMDGLLQHDRGLKRQLERTALYLDDDLQQSLKKETGYYLPLSTYNDKSEFNKYKQSDSEHKKGLKVMSRLQGFNEEDDFAKMLIDEGKTGRTSSAIKVLGYTATDPSIVEKTLEKVRGITTQDNFNDIVLTLLDTANTELLKKGKGRKLGKIFEETGAKNRMVDYMYILSEQAKDYDPTKDEETKGYSSDYNGFKKYNSNYSNYNSGSNYGSFKNQDGLYDKYKPVRDFVNNNRGSLSNNPYQAVESRLYTGKAQPSNINKLFSKYYLPLLQSVRLDPYNKGPITETGGKGEYQPSVTYKKLLKTKKIRVRQNKVRSKKKYARKTGNLLSGMTFGKIN